MRPRDAAALPSTADRNRLRELALSTVRHGGWDGPVEAVIVYEAGRLIVQARPALTPQQPESPAPPQTEAVDGIKQWARDRVAKGRQA